MPTSTNNSHTPRSKPTNPSRKRTFCCPPIPPRSSSKRPPSTPKVTLSPSLIPLPLFHPLAPRPLAPGHPSLNKPLPPLPREDARARGDGYGGEDAGQNGGGVVTGRANREEGVLVEKFSVSKDEVWARMPGMHPRHTDVGVSPMTGAFRGGEDVGGEEMAVEMSDGTFLPSCKETTQVHHENENKKDVPARPKLRRGKSKGEKVGSLGIYFDYCFAGKSDASDDEECACNIKDSDDEDLLAKIGPMFPKRPDNYNGDKSKGDDGDSLRSESTQFHSLSEAADWPSAGPAQAALSDPRTEARSLGQNLRRVDPAGNLRNLRKRYDPDAESAYSRSICGSSIKGLYQLPRQTWQENDAEGHSQGCINQAGYSSDGERETSLCRPRMLVRDV
ncbi:MAG: hypothetical protein Q9174_006847 [Haloplaca sp. 1 TL-2023]